MLVGCAFGPRSLWDLRLSIRSQGIKYSKFGIEIKTFAYVISSSKSTSQATYHAMAKILWSDYNFGFCWIPGPKFCSKPGPRRHRTVLHPTKMVDCKFTYQTDDRFLEHRHKLKNPGQDNYFPTFYAGGSGFHRRLLDVWHRLHQRRCSRN